MAAPGVLDFACEKAILSSGNIHYSVEKMKREEKNNNNKKNPVGIGHF